MRCVARTQFVNRSEGQLEPIPLTPRQLYDGLKIKARDPREFVAMIEHCQVLSESEMGLLREVKFKGSSELVQERVEFFEPTTAEFTMFSMKGDTIGRVLNIISTTPDGETLLTFAFAIGRSGQEDDGTITERAKAITDGADMAITQTINVIRKLVEEGKL